jgi:glutamate---cysteine ligase / carboxylate-amine ligase
VAADGRAPAERDDPLELPEPNRWPDSEPLTAEACATAFAASGTLTIGIEEELILVDPETLLPAAEAERVLAAVARDGRFRPELKRSQVEIVTPACATVAEACSELGDARRVLVRALGGSLRLASAGTHPLASGFEEVTAGERYRSLVDEYQWVARGSLACGLHVHVAPGGAGRALPVFNAVRRHLPELAALSTNSPFFAGEDTGLASVRQLGETFPRTGVPPAFGSWQELARYLEWGRRSGLFPDGTHIWWDLRPHVGHGTIELRVPDAQTRVADTAALAAVFVCLVAELGERHDAGERLPEDPPHLVAENGWRALRYGVRGWLVDLDTGEVEPTAARIRRLLERLEPVAERLACADELCHAATLLLGTGADRQRYVAERESLERVVRRIVDETEAAR